MVPVARKTPRRRRFECQHGRSSGRPTQHERPGSNLRGPCLEKIRPLTTVGTRSRDCKKQGRRHVNQTRTFCREEISDITDIAGDWEGFFARENMNEQELAELDALEQWDIDGPLLGLFEELPDPDKLKEALDLIEKMRNTLTSAKVLLTWANMIQQNLFTIYMEDPARGQCMRDWAKTRSYLANRFL